MSLAFFFLMLRLPPRSTRTDTLFALPDALPIYEPRHHVAIAAADLHLRARAEDEEAFAVRVRLDLLDLIEVDDGRAVDALEVARVEPLFQILHRLAQDQAVVGDRKSTRLNSSH